MINDELRLIDLGDGRIVCFHSGHKYCYWFFKEVEDGYVPDREMIPYEITTAIRDVMIQQAIQAGPKPGMETSDNSYSERTWAKVANDINNLGYGRWGKSN